VAVRIIIVKTNALDAPRREGDWVMNDQKTTGDVRKRELRSIQYLRGVAAMLVLITHTMQWPLSFDEWNLLKTGRLGVDIFFVISGFIITVIAGDGAFDPVKFTKRRAFRIIPAYWAATLLVTALALLLPQQFRTTIPTIEGFLKSLVFIPSLDPKAPLLNLGWTLNYEAFFYLIFAGSFFLKSEARTVLHVVLLAVLVAIGQFMPDLGYVQAFYTSPSLIGFIFGTLVGQLYRHGYLEKLNGGPLILSGIIALGLAFAYYVMPWESLVKAPLHVHLVLSLLSALIVSMAVSLELNERLGRSSVMKLIGDASYSIYLFHLFPLGAYWAVGKRVFDISQPAIYIPLVLIGIGVNLGFGLLCFWLVERPFLNLSRRPQHRSVPV
jgi:exopolysaccharide production protein ExoZ